MTATVPWYDVCVLHGAKHFIIIQILRKKLPLYLNYSQWVLIINSLVQQTSSKTQSATIDWNWVIILWYESHLWGGSWRECCPGHDSSRYNKLGVHATATRQGLNGVWPRPCPDHNHPHLNQTVCLQHQLLDIKQGWNLKQCWSLKRRNV